MTPATLLRDATADGVVLRMSDGTLKASGEHAALIRWLPIIREHKAAILELLRAANDTGPRLDDLDEPGRSAGWRIYRALLEPAPAAEPVARPDAHDPTPHYRDHEGEQSMAHVLAQCERDADARRYFLDCADRLAHHHHCHEENSRQSGGLRG